MSKYKILLNITGSIAAYKSCYLISKLIQNNYEVQIAATNSALEFIGKATLEGLTGKRVFTDTFAEGEMMSHINLTKWADLTITAPASANTINKFAFGLADNLVSSLFLAHDIKKPYIIAPAMNTNMYMNPTTQKSLQLLSSRGINILPTEKGHLACGDVGEGKMLNPDIIYERINQYFKPQNAKNILITAGGTKENLDGIRFITNLSSGITASNIADSLIHSGNRVTFLHSTNSAVPNSPCELFEFDNFSSLENNLKKLLSNSKFDLVIHQAAVSDYSAVSIAIGDETLSVPIKQKLNSENDEMTIHFKKNDKLINKIKGMSSSPIMLIGFKFTNSDNDKVLYSQVNKLIKDSSADYIIQNDLGDRHDGIQQNFNFYDKKGLVSRVKNSAEVAFTIEKLLSSSDKENV